MERDFRASESISSDTDLPLFWLMLCLLQSLLTGLVTTNMSKVKKQSLFTPSPATYARSAVGTIGILSRTSGYWPHSFMVSAIQSPHRTVCSNSC